MCRSLGFAPVPLAAGRLRRYFQVMRKPRVSYSQAAADHILDEMRVHGRDLIDIVRSDPGMPSLTSVYSWMDAEPEAFGRPYARAREMLGDHAANGIERIVRETTGENANANRVKLTALQWLASRYNPRLYGDKNQTELVGRNGGPLQVQPVPLNLDALSDDQLDALRDAMVKQLPPPTRG